MMGGFGTLKQGMDTFKSNRALQNKKGHKPFERKDIQAPQNIPFVNDTVMTDEVRDQLRRENEEFNRSEIKRKLTMAIAAIILIGIGHFVMGSVF
jgi:hypothetical protein